MIWFDMFEGIRRYWIWMMEVLRWVFVCLEYYSIGNSIGVMQGDVR